MTARAPSVRERPRQPLRVLAALAILGFCIPGQGVAQLDYCEQDGVIVFEVEDQPPAGDWVEETQYSGFTGASYFRWDGGDQFNNPGLSPLTYTFHVTTPGDYLLNIHNHHNDPDSTEANDCWTRLDGGTWLKTYSSQNFWNWVTRFEYADHTKEQSHFQLSAGTHTFQISGRSQDFRIDRVHLALDDSPGTSVPVSPVGNCDGPAPHPEKNARSVTAVFADGTFGVLEAWSGNPVTLPDPSGQGGRYLALTDNARLVLPGVRYTDQELLVRVRKGMPENSWLGVTMRAEDEDTEWWDAGGTHSTFFLEKQTGTGQVRVSVHDGSAVVLSGPYLPLAQIDTDARGTNMRITTSGDTVWCTLNGYDALPGGYSGLSTPGAGGYTSLTSGFAPGTPGEIGLDYCLVRAAGDIPDVYFDAKGKLWISALETDLLISPTWQPLSFAFHHDAYSLNLNVFVGIVFPYLDIRGSDDDHFVLGVANSGLALPVGSSNVLEYKGQREGEYQP